MPTPVEVFLEIGKVKVFAVAIDWPGWGRWGKDEGLAIQALLDSGARYAKIARAADFTFPIPGAPSAFHIAHRLPGNATTDFGAPDAQLPDDWEPLDAGELGRFKRLLAACWSAFDEAVELGRGKELRKGPRGGGRDLAKIMAHVAESEEGYLNALGWKPQRARTHTPAERQRLIREDVVRGLEAAAAGQLPREGPRGGKRWPVRAFARRLAWHAVDHAWEIEDRILD